MEQSEEFRENIYRNLCGMPKDHLLTIKDLCQILSISEKGIRSSLWRGKFPKPYTNRSKCLDGVGVPPRDSTHITNQNFWLVAEILPFVEERLKLKTTRECSACGIEKVLVEFYKGDGKCKLCKLKYAKGWRSKNPVNPEKVAIYNKRSRIKNPSSHKLAQRNHYVKNAEKLKQYSKEHSKDNREGVKDVYVRREVARSMGVKARDVPQELVDVVQVQILIKRKIKEIQNGK